jgi:hypothetical protein
MNNTLAFTKKIELNEILKTISLPFLYSFNFLLLLPYVLILLIEGGSILLFYIIKILRVFPGVKNLEKIADEKIQSLAQRIMKDERDYPFLKVALTVTPLVVGFFISLTKI